MFINMNFSIFNLVINLKSVEFFTLVQTAHSGMENRIPLNSLGVNKYLFEKEVLSEVKIKDIFAFFQIAKGRANSFKFSDYLDFQAFEETIEESGQLTKSYFIGQNLIKKPITKPRKNSVKIKYLSTILQEEVDFTVDYETGILQFLIEYEVAKLKVSFEYDYEVRFEHDDLKLEKDIFGNLIFNNLSLIEVL